MYSELTIEQVCNQYIDNYLEKIDLVRQIERMEAELSRISVMQWTVRKQYEENLALQKSKENELQSRKNLLKEKELHFSKSHEELIKRCTESGYFSKIPQDRNDSDFLSVEREDGHSLKFLTDYVTSNYKGPTSVIRNADGVNANLIPSFKIINKEGYRIN